MLSPFKLSIAVFTSVVALVMAPYGISKLVHRGETVAAGPIPPADNNAEGPSELPVVGAVVAAEPETVPVAVTEPSTQKNLALPVAPAEPVKVVASLPAAELPRPVESVVITEALPAPAIAQAPTPTPKPEIPYRVEVSQAQGLMDKLGIGTGKADGKLGPKTVAALKTFQTANALTVTGEPDLATLRTLEKNVATAEAAAEEARKVEVARAENARIAVENATQETAALDSADDPNLLIIPKDTEIAAKPEAYPLDSGPVPTLQNVKDVQRIQKRLIATGFYNEEPDGKWGALTIAAVREFQEKNELKLTGKPNSETWKKLNDKDFEPAVREVAAAPAKVETVDVNPVELPGESLQISQPEVVEEKASASVTSDKLKIVVSAAAEEAVPAVSESVAVVTEPPSLSEGSNSNVVVRVNSDAGSGEVAVLATPSAVVADAAVEATNVDEGVEVNEAVPAADMASFGEEPAAPEVIATARVTAAVPAAAPKATNGPRMTLRLPGSAPAPAVAEADEDAEVIASIPSEGGGSSAIDEELKEAQELIATVSRDPQYEPGKYAPEALESVNDLITKMKRDASSNESTSAESGDALKRIEREVAKIKEASRRKKAETLVTDVKTHYESIKKRFSPQLRREPLAEQMARVDEGYAAMLADFKKGNYDPIVDRCEGFKISINLLQNNAAKKYVDDKLKQKTVASKIKESTRTRIEGLAKQNKNVEAADLLDKTLEDDQG